MKRWRADAQGLRRLALRGSATGPANDLTPDITPRRWRASQPLALAALGLVLALGVWHWEWLRIVAELMRSPPQTHGGCETTASLHRYRVESEALPIQGLGGNASGLTYNARTQTLFVAINREPAVAEVALDGRLLHYWRLPPDVQDSEGIAHVQDDMFVVTDEADQRLHWLRIAPGAPTAQRVGVTALRTDFSHWHNLGLEGASWDEVRNELLVSNEKWPRKLLAIGNVGPTPGARAAQVRELPVADWLGLLGADVASLTVDARTDHLWLLSEESALVSEYSRDGQLRGLLPLWRGWAGLRQTAPRPEGIALAPDGALYVLSEPNLLYRFRPGAPEAGRAASAGCPVQPLTTRLAAGGAWSPR